MKAIEVESISKSFGPLKALDDVSFTVEQGDVVALIGPNGAGKTTLLRILATLGKPDSGYAKILDMDGRFQASKIRGVMGYMPDSFGMYKDLTVIKYLDFFAGIYSVQKQLAHATVADLMTLLELEPLRDRPTSGLSRGMQQRVALARTLINDPDILILDEPAANLDPRARIEIRETLKELQRRGKTILISSHILMELDELCNKILLMEGGKIRYYGGVKEVIEKLRGQKEISLKVEGDTAKLCQILEARNEVQSVSESAGSLKVVLAEEFNDHSFLLEEVLKNNMKLLTMNEKEINLEDVFMRLTSKSSEL
jgi:ABC-2 type transport system ATP-binding protein